MSRRVALRAWVLCWLVLVWDLLWGKLSVANIVGGLAVAVLIIVLLPLPVVPVEGRLHPLSLARFVVQVGWYLAVSSVQMAWLAIKPGPPPKSAVLRAQLAIKSDLVLALAVNTINLIPGTIVVDIDQSRRTVYVHVLDVGSAEAVTRFHHEIAVIERLLITSFERDADWQPATEERA